MDTPEKIFVQIRPFTGSTTSRNWRKLVDDIASAIEAEGFDLIIFDTLFGLWPVKDENDAAQVKNALMPLNELADLGAGVLLVAHTVKGDAPSGSS